MSSAPYDRDEFMRQRAEEFKRKRAEREAQLAKIKEMPIVDPARFAAPSIDFDDPRPAEKPFQVHPDFQMWTEDDLFTCSRPEIRGKNRCAQGCYYHPLDALLIICGLDISLNDNDPDDKSLAPMSAWSHRYDISTEKNLGIFTFTYRPGRGEELNLYIDRAGHTYNRIPRPRTNARQVSVGENWMRSTDAFGVPLTLTPADFERDFTPVHAFKRVFPPHIFSMWADTNPKVISSLDKAKGMSRG